MMTDNCNTCGCSQEPEERTVLAWLCDAVAFPIPEPTAKDILVNREVDPESLPEEVDKMLRDLSLADLYMWILTAPSRKGDVTDSDNSWRHSEGGYTLSEADKKRFLSLANSIYDAYGEERKLRSSIRIHSFGIRRVRR